MKNGQDVLNSVSLTVKNSRGTCIHCGSISWSDAWFKAFSIKICSECALSQEQLLSKGNAQQRYALTEGDLRKLGSLLRDNPQYKGGAKMRLLLVSQVEEIAIAKHGSMDDIELLLQERRHAKSGPELKKKQCANDRKAAQLQARIHTMKAQLSDDKPRLSRVLNRTVFDEEEEI